MKTKWSLLEKKSKLTPFDIPIDYNILNILANRGITKKNDIIKFINPKLENLEDPQGLIDLDLAILEIEDAIKNDKKICIYGDYDVDGITSTSILYLSLKKLGTSNIIYYIPLRNEGYGLNKNAIDEIKSKNVDLIITVDCGISSHSEVEYIKELGMRVVITDHHDIPSNIPKSHACVNPKRLDNKYSFPNLAGVGVVFMLVYTMFKKLNRLEEIFDFLDIVALGTIADIMPLIKENRIIVKHGLEKFKTTKNLGLRSIINKLELNNKDITVGDVSFKIAPIFNAVGRLSDAKLAVKLLISESTVEINALAQNLISNNINRKKIQDEIIDNLLEEIEHNNYNKKDILIFHSPEFHHGIIGIVASKVVEKYYKPAIIIEENLDEGIAVGSCRSVEGFNITKALSYFSKDLIKFGGHSNAAGFTIKLENLEKFKKDMEEYATKQLQGISLIKNINIDMKIPAQKISYEFIQSLNLLKPFGFGNSTPILMTENCIIHNPNLIGAKKQHLKFDIDQKGFSVKNAIWFNNSDKISELTNDSIFYDIVFKLEISEFNDRFYPNILIEDMKKSKLKDDRFHFYHSMYYTSFPIKSVFYTTIDIDSEDKLHIKKNFSNYSIMMGKKTISKLDQNISNLLDQLHNFYNYEFEIKIEEIDKRQYHNIVHILIKKKHKLENYSNSDSVQFRNIKNFLLKDIPYNDFTKKALSIFYKENKSIHINRNNIKIELEEEPVDITESYLYNLLLTISIKYYFENDRKINFYTTNKYFKEKPEFKTYCNFIDKINIRNSNDICIFDFNSIKLPNFKLNYEKAIVIYDSEIKSDKLENIIFNIKLPKNIVKINKNLLKNIDYESIFLHYLPIENKKYILELAKKGKIIYTDNSIIDYY